jgi:hypothetical protein
MSLVYSAGGTMPLPTLAWDFNGTATDYVSGVKPSSANVNGVYQSTTTWPYYDTVSQKYGAGSSIYLLNSGAPTVISNCIFFNTSTGINIPFGGSNTSTISFWYKFLTAPGGTVDNTLVFLTNNEGSKTSYIFAKNPSTSIGSYGNFSGASAGVPNSGSSQVTAGTWYHVAQTTTNTTQILYVNGTQVGSRTYTAINADNSNVWNSMSLGTYYFGTNPGTGASCELEDLRIYKQVLTSAQIQAVYNQQGVPGRGAMTSSTYLPTLPGYSLVAVSKLPSSFTLTQTSTSNAWTYGSGQVTDGGANPILTLVATAPSDLYSARNPGIWYRLGRQGAANEYVRHAGFVMGLSGYAANNFDFAWAFFLKNGTTNQVKIWNPYPGNGTGYWVQSGIQTAGRIAISTTDPLQAHIYTISVPPSPPTSLTGTPLFNQLSQAARSSAVGAFSLRAVNGTTARAVQVRAPQGQFPPAAMTADTTSLTGYSFGGSGIYVASASLDDFFIAYGFNAFDNNLNTYWHSNYPIYTAATGIYINGDARASLTAGIYAGEWLQIKTPTPILLLSYSLVGRPGFETNRSPRKFWILGSNDDGVNWSLVDTQTNINTWAGPQVLKTFTISNPGTTYFNIFRIVVNEVGNLTTGGQDSVQIATWNLVGYPPSTDFYADRLGNLLTAPVTGQRLANWLGGATGYVTTWYDQSGQGNHMAAANQPVINTATTPASLIFTGTEYFQNTVPFTFNFGSAAFTLRYVVSNNTGGIVLYKADSADFTWSLYEKKFWLGNGTTTETSQGGYPSQVGYAENYSISSSAMGSTKTSVVHKATSATTVPIYLNGTLQTLTTVTTNMKNDPGNFLYFGRGGQASNYIGNLHEIQIFSTAFSDADRLALEN